ncbi:MAG TPA: HPr family phosphocarrier protein, partial [Candidatus Nanopelagicales bacterium]|nr:HPr family phosphocarrier protein [Candidatus Nanopelagicales bacterium]
MQTLEIEIRNPNGLHLRPLGQFVRTCGRTRSEVTIQNLATGAGPANAKQMLRVQPLGIRMGHLVRITAAGDDEVEAIATIRAAIEAGLGEEVAPPAPAARPEAASAPSATPPAAAPAPAPAPALASPPDPSARRLVGLGAVAGIAVAPAWRYREQAAGVAPPAAGDPGDAIRAASAAAESQLDDL